jgi:hypothetical protein
MSNARYLSFPEQSSPKKYNYRQEIKQFQKDEGLRALNSQHTEKMKIFTPECGVIYKKNPLN